MEAVIKIHVKVNARRNEVVGLRGDAIKIHIAAPPVEGRANEELVSFLAEILEVPKRDVKIKTGASSRLKLVSVDGLDSDSAKSKLLEKSMKYKV